jgi:hypothetical protein
MDGKKNHYAWSHVPNHDRTEKQILKAHRRLKKHAQHVGTITLIFDKARCAPLAIPCFMPLDGCLNLTGPIMSNGRRCIRLWR